MTELKKTFKVNEFIFKPFTDLTEEESDNILKWRNDPKVRMWMNNDHIISLVEHEHFIQELKKDCKTFYWLIAEDNKEIGVVSLKDVDWDKKSAWLGIFINPDFHSQGFGSRIILSAEEIFFKKSGFDKLQLEMLAKNERAKALYSRCGFVETGVIKNKVKRDNENIDTIIMEKLNEDKSS